MFLLDEEDLQRLTGKTQRSKQCQALATMGIPFGKRLDGHPVVTREAVLRYTGTKSDSQPVASLNLKGL